MMFRRILAPVAFCAGVMWSAAVSATTLTYVGNNFDSFGFLSQHPDHHSEIYTTNMRVEMTIVLDQKLKANMTNARFTGQVDAFAGITTILGRTVTGRQERNIYLSTDTNKNIIGWDIRVCDGWYCGNFDFHDIRVSSGTGDVAKYNFEMDPHDVDQTLRHSAFAATPGVLTVQPVPLPAAGFAMLTALAGMAALRRKKRPASA